jgi:hypothetical protein
LPGKGARKVMKFRKKKFAVGIKLQSSKAFSNPILSETTRSVLHFEEPFQRLICWKFCVYGCKKRFLAMETRTGEDSSRMRESNLNITHAQKMFGAHQGERKERVW